MKTQLLITTVFFFLGLNSSTTFGQNLNEPQNLVPGFLTDYQFQVTNLSSVDEAQALMDTELMDTKRTSICSNRAHLWAYIMTSAQPAVQIGKVFIHFTNKGEATENSDWAYHVAPYVLVNGEEMVLDSGFGVFNKKPVKLSKWTKYFGKSENCVVLDPIHNPQHLKYEQNNLPNDWVTPLTYTSGGARQYPSKEGRCYIRKTPMYYWYPYQVYGADLYMAGQPEYSKFVQNNFERGELLMACSQATTLGFKLKNSCEEYLGFR